MLFRVTGNGQGASRLKVLVLYFSGTGNTHFVARAVAERLAGLADRVDLFSIEQLPPTRVAEYDVLIAGFPVYALESPPLFQAYLAALPRAEGRGALVFCTAGGVGWGAARRNLDRLAALGYVPLGQDTIPMPGTDGLAMLPKDSRLARRVCVKDYRHSRQVERLVRRAETVLREVAGGRSFEELRMKGVPRLVGLGLARPMGWLYDFLARLARRSFWVDGRCNQCGLCAQICQHGNVACGSAGVTFGDNCELCLRCVHLCPQEAIQIGRLTMNTVRWRGPDGRFDARMVAGLRRQGAREGRSANGADAVETTAER